MRTVAATQNQAPDPRHMLAKLERRRWSRIAVTNRGGSGGFTGTPAPLELDRHPHALGSCCQDSRRQSELGQECLRPRRRPPAVGPHFENARSSPFTTKDFVIRPRVFFERRIGSRPRAFSPLVVRTRGGRMRDSPAHFQNHNLLTMRHFR